MNGLPNGQVTSPSKNVCFKLTKSILVGSDRPKGPTRPPKFKQNVIFTDSTRPRLTLVDKGDHITGKVKFVSFRRSAAQEEIADKVAENKGGS